MASRSSNRGTAAVRGTIHDNPWAGVAPEEEEESGGTTALARRNNNNQQQLWILEEGMGLQALDLLIQVLLCFDACTGVFDFIFGFILYRKHSSESFRAVVWMLIPAGLFLLRTIAVTWGLVLPTDSLASCRRGGLTVAAYLSAVLAAWNAGNVVCGILFSQQIKEYLASHPLDLSSNQVQQILVRHYSWWMILLTVAALVEGMKYFMYRVYRRSILAWEDEQERLEEQDLIRREAATGRPWWWTSSYSRHGHRRRHRHHGQDGHDDAGLSESLLDHSSPSRRRGRRGFLGRLFARSPRNRDAMRDDGSVDFASVQEEWASRAEEDPVWWSREDSDEDAFDNHLRTSAGNGEVDTSWANDVAQI